jgi:hypothetical protein
MFSCFYFLSFIYLIIADLTAIPTDGTVKTLIWRDTNIQENLIYRSHAFIMPQDGYVVFRAGASSNPTTTRLSISIIIQNTLRVAEISSADAYAEASVSTPYLKKNTPVTVEVTMTASSWSSETKGLIDCSII